MRIDRQRVLLPVLVLAVALGAARAEAQWYKPWHKRKPVPTNTVPVSAAPDVAPTPKAEAPHDSVTAPLPVQSNAPVVKPVISQAASASSMPPERAARKAHLVQVALDLDARAASLDLGNAAAVRELAERRLKAWKDVKVLDPEDADASAGMERARKDIADVQQHNIARQKERADSLRQVREHLLAARAALRGNDLMTAETETAAVLAADPQNQEALEVQRSVHAKHQERIERRRTIVQGGIGLVLTALFGFALYKLVPRIREARANAAAKPVQAILQVVEGVGRGRMVSVDREVFRIGSVESDRPDEHNDLVLSDSAATISRNHCSLLRRGRRYHLFDSSANGTCVNGRALARGEDRPLRHGDEFTIAQATRIRFLLV